MLHTAEITKKFSEKKFNRFKRRLFLASEREAYESGTKTYMEANPPSCPGMSFKAYPGGDDGYHMLAVTINPQSLILGRHTALAFSCTPENVSLLSQRFRDVLADFGIQRMSILSDWYPARIDFAIDVFTPNVARYVALSKLQNRPYRYYDNTDRPGSTYAESNSVTINFYDKQDQLRNTRATVPNFAQQMAEAQDLYRLELQCERPKLKSLKRKYNLAGSRLGYWLREDLTVDVVRHYYEKVMGYAGFHSLAHAESRIDQAGLRPLRTRVAKQLLRYVAGCGTLPEALRLYRSRNGTRSSWYNYKQLCDGMDVNFITIPEDWGIDHLPNPMPAEYRA